MILAGMTPQAAAAYLLSIPVSEYCRIRASIVPDGFGHVQVPMPDENLRFFNSIRLPNEETIEETVIRWAVNAAMFERGNSVTH